MPGDSTQVARLKCGGCGFEAPLEGDVWGAATHPTLGTLTQCPECGSTNVHSQR